MKYRKYTEEDEQFLRDVYPTGNWNKIFERFPDARPHQIRRKCFKLDIKIQGINNRKPNRKKWTQDEDDFLINNYSVLSLDEIIRNLSDRSENAIIIRASKLGIKSKAVIEQTWTEEEIQFIKDNWVLTPDKVMAKKIGRTFRSVKAKREELGFYRRDMDSIAYPTLSKYLRGQNQKWKKDSMNNCNYRCIITGSKNFQIHHLYGVSNIINDIFNDYPEYSDKDFSNYSDDELKFLTEKFIEYQDKYPLGVCIDNKIHTLFHSLYGQYYNTPEQWYQFEEDYRKGLYID